MTVFKIARIDVSGGDEICLIRNISSHGLMIETRAPLDRNQHVEIEIRSDRKLEGVVRWTRAGTAGIKLDTAADVTDVLRPAPSRQSGSKSRAPRFKRDGTARIRNGRDTTVAPIGDISLSGACLKTAAEFQVNEMISISIEGLGDIPAEVRWIEGEALGLHFLHPLKFREFEEWLLKGLDEKPL